MTQPVMFEKMLVESFSDSVVAVSTRGLVLYANDAFLRKWNYRAGDVVGKPCREVVHESLCGKDCPFGEVLETGRPVDRFDVEIPGRDGQEMTACVNFTPLVDANGARIGVVEVIRDITKLKELKDTLKQTSTLYRRERVKNRTILDSIPSGVYTVDPEMTLLSFNRSLERITGHRADEAVGRKCTEIIRSDFCAARCPLKRSMRTGETLRGVEMNLRTKEGEVVPIAASTAVLRDENGEPIGAICSFRDLREYAPLPVSRGQVREFQGMVSKNHKMHEIFDLIETIAEADANVLIEGESGTGKELVARAIHRLSGRGEKPFLGVNCASLNENLMESELFGHVRGAFTGAIKDRPGRFETAEGGTIFLDEVSEIGPHLQAKLLRVIQEREFVRVGDTCPIRTDVRVIAATNRRLKDRIAGGAFRDDLYYRLNVVSILLPPLRERREDIPALAEHFLNRGANRKGDPHRTISPLAMQALLEYPWPGNVRELENAVERARICSRGPVIEEAALPVEIRSRGQSVSGRQAPPLSGAETGDAARLREALARCRWNREETAAALGISRVTLWRRMRKLGIAG